MLKLSPEHNNDNIMIILCQLQILSLALGTKLVPNCCAHFYQWQRLAPSASGEDCGGMGMMY